MHHRVEARSDRLSDEVTKKRVYYLSLKNIEAR